MRLVLIFFALVVAVGTFAARSINDNLKAQGNAQPKVAMAATAQPQQSIYARTTTLRSDGRGHFEAEARIDGRSINMMVDTGASAIALRESAANRLGIFPGARDYTAQIQTANGVGRAAPVRLSRVELGEILVRDVDAFVVPDSALGVNLLGMSFLSRVKWSHDRGRLVLEQ